ncbi:MAG: helix-turn-helix domain-containing protein [Dehalococcoidia bacterium]
MGKDMGNDENMSDMLTVREVARIFHVHPNTLRRWSNNGRIKAYRITPRGDRRFKREEIAQFLAELNSHVDNYWQEAESRQRSQW